MKFETIDNPDNLNRKDKIAMLMSELLPEERERQEKIIRKDQERLQYNKEFSEAMVRFENGELGRGTFKKSETGLIWTEGTGPSNEKYKLDDDWLTQNCLGRSVEVYVGSMPREDEINPADGDDGTGMDPKTHEERKRIYFFEVIHDDGDKIIVQLKPPFPETDPDFNHESIVANHRYNHVPRGNMGAIDRYYKNLKQ